MTLRAAREIDRVWLPFLSVYYSLLFLYGVTAWLFPIRVVADAHGGDRASVFGGLIALAGLAMLVGNVRWMLRSRPQLEMWAIVGFLVLMSIYLAALYTAVIAHEPGSRPGSAFLPLLFSLAPFTRLLAIVRSGEIPWVDRFYRRGTKA